MARTAITPQDVILTGLAPSFAAGDQANGHQFANDGNCILEVKNTGAGACTVTVQTALKVGGMVITNPTVVVPITTGDRMIGPFDPTIFNQAAGVVWVDLSTGTGVTVAVFHLPN